MILEARVIMISWPFEANLREGDEEDIYKYFLVSRGGAARAEERRERKLLPGEERRAPHRGEALQVTFLATKESPIISGSKPSKRTVATRNSKELGARRCHYKEKKKKRRRNIQGKRRKGGALRGTFLAIPNPSLSNLGVPLTPPNRKLQ